MRTAIVVFAHGSSVESANEAVRAATAQVAAQGGFDLTTTAFLELATPNLAAAVDSLVAQGAQRIIVVPYFLTLGIHLKRDLPKLVSECTARHPGLTVEVTAPLDGHPSLTQIVLERAQKALSC